MSAPVKALAAGELFRGLTSIQLEKLANLAKVMPASSGSSLFRLGDTAESLYLVSSGRVALTLPIDLEGLPQDLTVDEKGAGELVGWSALVPPHRSTLSAKVVVDSELVVFEGPALAQALAADQSCGHRVMANLSEVVGRRLHQMQAMWLRELQRLITSKFA